MRTAESVIATERGSGSVDRVLAEVLDEASRDVSAERLRAVHGRNDFVAGGLELHGQGLQDDCVIINYEDFSGSSWRERRQLNAGRRHFCRRQIQSRPDSVHPEIQPFHLLPSSRMDTKPLNWNQTRRRKATLRKMSRKKIFVPMFRAGRVQERSKPVGRALEILGKG